MMIAADLKRRLLWWSHDDGRWYFVPAADYEQRFKEINAWRSIAPGAIDALVKFMESEKGDPASGLHFARFQTIQDTLVRAQNYSCAGSEGWLYRSLLLDHRWMLSGFALPQFDEFMFLVMLINTWSGAPDEETVQGLQRDPVICAMPALYETVFAESWKTGVILTLKHSNILAVPGDIDQAIWRMVARSRFTAGQAAALQAHHGPLFGERGEMTKADVVVEVASARLDSPEAGRNDYVPFSLPTPDKALVVRASLRVWPLAKSCSPCP